MGVSWRCPLVCSQTHQRASSGEVTGIPLGTILGAAFCCEGDSRPDQVFVVQERGNQYAGRGMKSSH